MDSPDFGSQHDRKLTPEEKNSEGLRALTGLYGSVLPEQMRDRRLNSWARVTEMMEKLLKGEAHVLMPNQDSWDSNYETWRDLDQLYARNESTPREYMMSSYSGILSSTGDLRLPDREEEARDQIFVSVASAVGKDHTFQGGVLGLVRDLAVVSPKDRGVEIVDGLCGLEPTNLDRARQEKFPWGAMMSELEARRLNDPRARDRAMSMIDSKANELEAYVVERLCVEMRQAWFDPGERRVRYRKDGALSLSLTAGGELWAESALRMGVLKLPDRHGRLDFDTRVENTSDAQKVFGLFAQIEDALIEQSS